jgi:putative addiction module component (TIGR02574 family)
MVDAALISRVRTLSAADRLELIGAVWETFSVEDAPITEAEKSLLDARLADQDNNPEDQSPWLEVQARLRRLLP